MIVVLYLIIPTTAFPQQLAFKTLNSRPQSTLISQKFVSQA